jgi:hypothetical protein
MCAIGLVVVGCGDTSGGGNGGGNDFTASTNDSTANNEATLGIIGTTVNSSTPSVATAEITSGKIKITSVSAGTATILVFGDSSKTASIPVTVAADGSITLGTINKYVPVTGFTPTTNDDTANTEAILGLIGTGISSSNPSVAMAFINNNNAKIQIVSIKAGSATITVSDAAGHKATIPATVAANGDITIGTIAKYVPSTGTPTPEAAQLAANINAMNPGSATVGGATVKIASDKFVYLQSDLTVPVGVTLDVTANNAALGLGDVTLTVNGVVNAGSNQVRFEDNASEVVINGNGTIYLKSKGNLFSIAGNHNKANHKLTLDGVTLVGLEDNDSELVNVRNGGPGRTGTFVMKSGKITGNTHTRDTGLSGGGVKLGDGGTFIMDGGEISGNTAQNGGGGSSGGGVTVEDNGTFTMNDGTISGNTAQNGGGVQAENGGKIVMTGGTISGNTASDGGGVNVDNGATFTMKGGVISDNTAKNDNGGDGGDGGGVRVIENGTFTMKDGEISGNTANSGSGGGVDVNRGTFTMKDGTISGNTARAGGGVEVWSGAFTMEGGAISGNTAERGGGVRVEANTTFEMSGGEISGNTSQEGGGVRVEDGAEFTMSGNTLISGNTASEGNGGGVQVEENATFIMEDGTISGNTAANAGGGVNVRDRENATFTKKGGTIYGDTDTTHTPGNTENTVLGHEGGNGHAVQTDWGRKRNADAGPEIKLYAKYVSGAWTHNDTSSGGVGNTTENWD